MTKDFTIKSTPFDWNDNFAELAIEDFDFIRDKLSYGTCQTIGMALAKLEMLEEQGCKVEATEAFEVQPNRCDSCIHSEEQDGSNCYECVKGMADNFEAQPCEDAISREALLEELGEEPFNWNDSPEEFQEVRDYQWFKSLVENAPSVAPETKTGHWIRQTDDYHDYYECEHCGIAVGLDDIRNYCPNCGATMEVDE